MTQKSENKTEKLPKYLIVIFVGILAVVGFGIGQKFYNPNNLPTVLGSSDEDIDGIDIDTAPLPIANEGIEDPNVRAKNIILLDADSKEMLFGQGAHNKVAIASITKVMTALLVIENNKLDDIVTVEKEDVNVIGSKVGLFAGEKIKISDLVKGLLMVSGNDAANVLARVTSGDSDKFVTLMNKKAKDLGLNDTKYIDPHGLSSEERSTAFDQAILFSYALNSDKFLEIINTDKDTIKSEDGYEHELTNSNRLITEELFYNGIIGGKTGFTYEAGHSLVSAAERDGHTLVSVVLNTSYSTKEASASESAKLLTWGFENYTWQ